MLGIGQKFESLASLNEALRAHGQQFNTMVKTKRSRKFEKAKIPLPSPEVLQALGGFYKIEFKCKFASTGTGKR